MSRKEYGASELRQPPKVKKLTSKKSSASANSLSAEWLIPAGLIFLSLVPALGGSLRLVELSSGAEFLPDSDRIASAPVPVVIHIISVVIYSILGAFQFAPGFRRRYRRWHRSAGRILIPSGLVAALSGLWMTQFSPLPWYDIGPLYWVRLVVGLGMTVSIVLGTLAIWRRNFAQHGAWMIRAYALGVGAGTQVFVLLPWAFFPSIHSELTRAILMATAWIINLAVAEWVIQKRRSRRADMVLSTRQRNSSVTIRS
ncbi:DUF2306 domain-containing protein [Chloroflexi bacterium TSY]|nr:DUF2306 domain-containing protein [Chloroflexi bacterium TSY]